MKIDKIANISISVERVQKKSLKSFIKLENL